MSPTLWPPGTPAGTPSSPEPADLLRHTDCPRFWPVLEVEIDNLRAAARWAIDQADGPLMVDLARRLWMTGAALLAVVVVKLFALDLGSLAGLPRVVAFLGVGVLLLLIGYLAPLPPAKAAESP